MLHPAPVQSAKNVLSELLEYHFIGNINTNITGYKILADFHRRIIELKDQTIQLNWKCLAHFDANLSALLFAWIQQLSKENNVTFQLDTQSIADKHNVFLRNGLASHVLGIPFVQDSRQSTIAVRCFTIDEINEFSQYIQHDMFCHPRLGSLSLDVKQRITSYFSELFCNVEIHADTNEVFVCGQFFPQLRELRFTMVDLGCGFLKKIAAHTAATFRITTAFDALKWAVSGNSTKTQAAGGSGLSNILKHCAGSRDSVHIISDGCYFQYDPIVSKKVIHELLDYHCGGTIIHMIFRGL